MAQTPEQKVHSALKSLLARSLPKGRWILQRIETSTGTGIPDCYCSLLVNEQHTDLWIETKTLEYKVSDQQLNWASAHWLTGGLTYVCTRIKYTPATRPALPAASSTMPAHANPYPQLLELLKTPSTQGITNSTNRKGQEQLVFLAFDDKMRSHSTLGVYLRRFNPEMLPVADWVQHIQDYPSQQP